MQNLEKSLNFKDPSNLKKFVDETDVKNLTEILGKKITSTDFPTLLGGILQTFSNSDVCQLKRRRLVENTLKILSTAKVPTSHADTIVNRIISDFTKYSTQHLTKLIDFCCNRIREDDDDHRSWKDLIPALLEALEEEKCITYIDNIVSGAEYKSAIVKSICNLHWKPSIVPCMAKLFGDMSLEKADCDEALRTLCHALPNLSADEVPSFAYQTLKLCRRRNSKYLLETLRKYFQNLYALSTSSQDSNDQEDIGVANIKEVRDIESTVLYYVYQAVQLDHESIKDFIQYIKSISCASTYVLQPFILAVLLSVSSIYEDQITDILKATINSRIQDSERRKKSTWLRIILPPSRDIVTIFEEVIDNSTKDRHLLLKGLVNFAFTLINIEQKSKANVGAIRETGAAILRVLLKKRHETIVTILQILIDKIAVGGLVTLYYTDYLAYACRKLTVTVLDHQVWITTLLDRLLLLPGPVAIEVLHAVFPLMRVSPSIRENLILMLRKALYKKGTSKRCMAITGFLEMLRNSKIQSISSISLSQCGNTSIHLINSSSTSTLTQITLESNTQQMKSPLEHNPALSSEVLAILKKCFNYEFDVRLHLYRGLHSVVEKNPAITETVLDLLLTHLDIYLETDKDIFPPLKLELCSDNQNSSVVLQEPIADLIFTIQKVYVNAPSKDLAIFKKLFEIIQSLSSRLIATELKDLNLDDEVVLSENVAKIERKLQNVSFIIMTFEALMAFEIGIWPINHETNERKLSELFKGYSRFMDYMTKVIKPKRGDGKNKKSKDVNNTTLKKIGKSTNIKLPDTILDLDVICKTLSLLYLGSIGHLQDNYQFHLYMLQTCQYLIQRLNVTKDEESKMRKKSCINDCIEIATLLYKNPLLNLKNTIQYNAHVAALVLQCFKELCYIICTSFSSQLLQFLNKLLDSTDTNSDINSQLQNVIYSLKPVLSDVFNIEKEEDPHSKKIPFLLLEIIEQFIHKINFEIYNPEKVHDWFQTLAEAENTPSNIKPMIIQILLRLEEYKYEYGEILKEICFELCDKFGSIDEIEIPTGRQYKILEEDAAVQIYSIVNNCVKEKLDNASWLLARLKAEETLFRFPSQREDSHEETLKDKERSLCRQLSYIVQILHTLANVSIDPGPCTDLTFKNINHLYNLLVNLTKYFYNKSSERIAAFQAVKFIQVIQVAGKPLKTAFYNLVSYIEETQNKLHSKSDSHVQRSKILKETKVIPRIVYEIEQFNKEIILLGKKTDVPLGNYMKHSITRDFRINNPQLLEGLEKMDISLLVTQDSKSSQSNKRDTTDLSHTTSEDDESTSRKRRRLSVDDD